MYTEPLTRERLAPCVGKWVVITLDDGRVEYASSRRIRVDPYQEAP